MKSDGATAVSALGGLWSVYYRRGYEDGSRQVIRDVLGSLVTLSEDFLRQHAQSADPGALAGTRQLLYAFEEYLENQIRAIANRDGFVEGGLGI